MKKISFADMASLGNHLSLLSGYSLQEKNYKSTNENNKKSYH